MNTNTTINSNIASKDLAPKGTITGGALTANHNETLVRAKDLAPQIKVMGGGIIVHDRRGR